MNVSFGKKIPISQYQILDKSSNKFVQATLSEFDCRDKSDIDLFVKDDGWWNYKDDVVHGMLAKINNMQKYDYLSKEEKAFVDSNKFFAIQDKDKNLIGVCVTIDDGTNSDIFFLETKNCNKYKYTGQGMIASLAKRLISKFQDPTLTVNFPAPSALTFYILTCGFKDKDCFSLYMKRPEMTELVDKFEKKTQMPIKTLS